MNLKKKVEVHNRGFCFKDASIGFFVFGSLEENEKDSRSSWCAAEF